MIAYWERYNGKLLTALTEHIQLVSIVLLISIVISGLIVFWLLRYPKWLDGFIYLFSVVYSIPSLALFALLIPLSGLGKVTAIIALVIYCQYILLRSFTIAIREVDPVMVEVAAGMGMTDNQIFKKIQLPLAMQPLLTGMKLAAISTIGIATIGATINAGGLGTILFDGLRTFSLVKIAWGTILTTGLCLAANLFFSVIESAYYKIYLKK